MAQETKQDDFITLVGSYRRADHIQLIWQRSWPTTQPKLMTKEEVFRENATKEGFTSDEINAFLAL